MLTFESSGSSLVARTGIGRIAWDAARGGQIVRCVMADETGEHDLLPRGAAWPGLVLEPSGGPPMRLSDVPAQVEVVRQTGEEVCFRASARLGGAAVAFDQQWEVFAEGAVFCEFTLTVGAAPLVLVAGHMTLPLDLASVANVRWGYARRRLTAFRDATRIHALFGTQWMLGPSDAAEEREVLPWAAVDLGWPPARLFSNRVEMLLEDAAPLGKGDAESARTFIGDAGNGWRLQWRLTPEGGQRLDAGYRYVNRWGLVLGAARTQAGRDAPPPRRNHLLAARIAHLGIPCVRPGVNWPWRVMQHVQDARYAPDYFRGMPALDVADDAARGGADTLMIHQGWMANGGTNNEPPADYRPADPDWLRAFVGRCHDLGMRVGLYMRGTEMYAMYSPFFEEFMEKDRDGFYVDWSSPLAPGWAKASPLHFSAHTYFLFTRELRRRVGEGGFLQAHCGHINSLLATLTFDSLASGEAAVQRDSLLRSPELCAHHGLLGGAGVCLLGRLVEGGGPQSPAAAYCAGLGINAKAGQGFAGGFEQHSAYMQPLWALHRLLRGPVARLRSEAVGSRGVSSSGDAGVYATVLEASEGPKLLLAANLGERPCGPTRVCVDYDALGLSRNARLRPVGPEAASVRQVTGREALLEGLGPLAFAGVIIE